MRCSGRQENRRGEYRTSSLSPIGRAGEMPAGDSPVLRGEGTPLHFIPVSADVATYAERVTACV